MFNPDTRNRIREHILQLAATDPRVVGGAEVGSMARGEGDRWSDLDLTFASRDDLSPAEVLEDWTGNLVQALQAVKLFDLTSGPSLYRVFLLPGCLQVDLSFTPASKFGATGSNFHLLFGKAMERPFPPVPPAEEMFGYSVHHILRARFSMERGRPWQAEYWIHEARDSALHLACRNRGLPSVHGRGFDALPVEVRDRFKGALAASLERGELLRALRCVTEGLMEETGEVPEMASRVEPALRDLMTWQDG